MVAQSVSTGEDISFDLTVRVKSTGEGDPPRFLGPFTQGPPDKRFVYVCSGTLAGQQASCWTRRAKVPLAAISWPLVHKALKTAGTRLEACFDGTARDGGPVCAAVSIAGGAWRVTE